MATGRYTYAPLLRRLVRPLGGFVKLKKPMLNPTPQADKIRADQSKITPSKTGGADPTTTPTTKADQAGPLDVTQRDSNIDSSIVQNEKTQAKTSSMMRHTQGGQGFVGQKKADAGSSPALRGFNLTVPGETKKAGNVFDAIIDLVENVIRDVAAGTLDKAGVDQALAKMPETTRLEAAELWAPAGEPQRKAFNAVMDRLAEALPDAKVGTMSAAEHAKYNHVLEADFKGDQDTVGKLSAELAKAFPDSQLSAMYSAYAKRGNDVDDGSFKAPQFSDASEVVGVLNRVANTDGDGISGAKGSLSDEELRFMADLVDASSTGRDLPLPPPGVDVDNVKEMSFALSLMGSYGNSKGEIQPADFEGIKLLAQKSADKNVVLEHHKKANESPFSDAAAVTGVLDRLANQGGDGISGAKGSLSDAELRFMSSMVSAAAKGDAQPTPPDDVDVENIARMCTEFSTMGPFGNSDGKIQESDFLAIRDLLPKTPDA